MYKTKIYKILQHIRYLIDNPPTVILTKSYCFPEDFKTLGMVWMENYKKKIIAIVKNKNYYRS